MNGNETPCKEDNKNGNETPAEDESKNCNKIIDNEESKNWNETPHEDGIKNRNKIIGNEGSKKRNETAGDTWSVLHLSDPLPESSLEPLQQGKPDLLKQISFHSAE